MQYIEGANLLGNTPELQMMYWVRLSAGGMEMAGTVRREAILVRLQLGLCLLWRVRTTVVY